MRHRQELVTGNDWEMTATVIIESMRWKSEKHFPGSLSEFSINHYAYDTFPESAARELSGDVRYICRSAQTDGTRPAPS